MQYFSVSLASAVYRCKCAVQWLLSAFISKGHINPFYWTLHWELCHCSP